jgi:microcystin degradation protein MlrC
MKGKPLVLFAGLFHETHTFLEGRSGLGDFQISRGDELLRRRGDSSPLGGALQAAAEFDWEVLPGVDFRASPGATVTGDVVEAFWAELVPSLREPLDAVYLVLHGAMVSESYDDVEGEILGRLRWLVGPAIPVFGVFDLHANFTQRMTEGANCLVAYRENPHTDARDAARLAAGLLQRCLLTGEVPRMMWHHPPLIWPPTGTGTATDPMRALEALARKFEEEVPEFWAVNVCAGYSFADTAETGVSFIIATVGAAEQARAALIRLGALAWTRRAEGNVTEPTVDEVFAQLDPLPPGLTVLVEPSDNIGGGAPGDGSGLLRALVERRIPHAAIAINDPEAVTKLHDLQPGQKLVLPIGGKGSRIDPGPFTLEVELIRSGPGAFALEDKQSHLASMAGDRFDMGPCAVVQHEGLTILLTSQKTPPFDLGQWRSQGIEPTTLSVIAVKAAVAHRRAYDPIAARMLWVDTPGPCTSQLRSLPFRRVTRPMFPLDPL